jgi:hypothetical protein
MHYKAKVLRRFPDAHPVVAIQWPDGTPRRVVVHATADGIGGLRMRPLTTGHSADQGHTAAWRDAHAWITRNPEWAG